MNHFLHLYPHPLQVWRALINGEAGPPSFESLDGRAGKVPGWASASMPGNGQGGAVSGETQGAG